MNSSNYEPIINPNRGINAEENDPSLGLIQNPTSKFEQSEDSDFGLIGTSVGVDNESTEDETPETITGGGGDDDEDIAAADDDDIEIHDDPLTAEEA